VIPPRLLTTTVAVVRIGPGTEDPYGNTTPTETSRSTQPAWLQQEGTREATDDRDTVVDRWLLILQAGTQIDAGDRVEEGGRVFEVDGTPDRKRTPSGEHHVEVRLHYVGEV